MRIRMKTRIAGPDGAAEPNAVLDLDKARAYDLIERGYAEQLGDEVERAVLPVAETAVGAPNRRRGRRS